MDKLNGIIKNIKSLLKARSIEKNENERRSLVTIFFSIIGIALIFSSLYLPLDIVLFPLFGFFLLLYSSIVNAQMYRVKLNLLRNGYLAAISMGNEIKPNIKKVTLYTFFCLLPLHSMFIIPAMLAIVIGEVLGWVILGVQFAFITYFAFHSFSSVWKDMHIKPVFFWLMQLLIFVTVNAATVLFFLI